MSHHWLLLGVIGIENEVDTYVYKLLYEDLSIDAFEQWVYGSDQLQELLSTDDHLTMISLNYRIRDPKITVRKIMEHYIDYAKLETQHLLYLLYDALNYRNGIADILRTLYDLYCNGYYFLQDLGLGYGLYCKVPPNKYRADNWEELSEAEKEQIINSFYPQLTSDIARAINWLENSHIVLTGRKDNMDRWMYDDNRTDEEKQSTVWVEVQKDHETGTSIRTNILWERQERKWWEWWKR